MDKRNYRRFPLFAEIFHCAVAEKKHIKIGVNDISCDGLGVSSDEKLRRGDVLELELKVPGDDIPIFAVGEVAWVVPDRGKKDTCRAGIRLTRIERNDKNRIVKFLHSVISFLG